MSDNTTSFTEGAHLASEMIQSNTENEKEGSTSIYIPTLIQRLKQNKVIVGGSVNQDIDVEQINEYIDKDTNVHYPRAWFEHSHPPFLDSNYDGSFSLADPINWLVGNDGAVYLPQAYTVDGRGFHITVETKQSSEFMGYFKYDVPDGVKLKVENSLFEFTDLLEDYGEPIDSIIDKIKDQYNVSQETEEQMKLYAYAYRHFRMIEG